MPIVAKVKSARNISSSIHYARDGKDNGREKLYDQVGINCHPNNAIHEFKRTQRLYKRLGHGVQIKKFIVGFGRLNKSGITPNDARRYMKSLLSKLNLSMGKGWRMCAFAHNNTSMYHYHVIVLNTNPITGGRYSNIYKDVEKLRKINDEISIKYHLSPVRKTRFIKKDMPEIKESERLKKHGGQKRYSYQNHVRTLIARGIMGTNNIDEFQKYLNLQHASLRSNFFNTKAKHGTMNIPFLNKDGHRVQNKVGQPAIRKVRTDNFGEPFDKKTILKQLSLPIEKRNDKYMSIYKRYRTIPNDVILNHKKYNPVQSKEKHHNATDYVQNDVLTPNFKSEKEINNEKQVELIAKIRKLNRKFSQSKSNPSRRAKSKGRTIELSYEPNQRAKQQISQFSGSIKQSKFDKIGFTKSIINQPQLKFVTSRRKQKSDSGQSESKKQEQAVNHSEPILQQSKEAINIFRRQREWKKYLRRVRAIRQRIKERLRPVDRIAQRFTESLSLFEERNRYVLERKRGNNLGANKVKNYMHKTRTVNIPKVYDIFKEKWIKNNRLFNKMHKFHYNNVQHRLGYRYSGLDKHGKMYLKSFYDNLPAKSKIYMMSLTLIGDSEAGEKNPPFQEISEHYSEAKNNKKHPHLTQSGLDNISKNAKLLLKQITFNRKELGIKDSTLVDDIATNIYKNHDAYQNGKHQMKYSDVITGNVLEPKGIAPSIQLQKYNKNNHLQIKFKWSQPKSKQNHTQEQSHNQSRSQHHSNPHNNTNTINRERKLIKQEEQRRRRGPHMHM